MLAPQLLTNTNIGLASPLRSTGDIQSAPLTSATPVAVKAATVTTKSTVAIGPEEAEKPIAAPRTSSPTAISPAHASCSSARSRPATPARCSCLLPPMIRTCSAR